MAKFIRLQVRIGSSDAASDLPVMLVNVSYYSRIAPSERGCTLYAGQEQIEVAESLDEIEKLLA